MSAVRANAVPRAERNGSPPGPASSARTPADARREVAALLLLLRGGRLAPDRYAELVEEQGSAIAVLRRERLADAAQTSFFADPEQEMADELAEAGRQVAGWQTAGMRIVSVLDDSYPANLRGVHDRPPMFFLAGRLKPADDAGVAVIGSRAASTQGRQMATAVAERLVACGYTVVSGLAAGIDTAAHTAALKRGGRTVAVLGTGLQRCYPRANVTLQRRIAAQCAVVSQFLPDAPPTPDSFRTRNAVMSGLSLASVIVEASQTSGARIQARAALSQGRPVFLLDSLLAQRWARDLSRRPGVFTASTPEDVTTVLDRLLTTPLVA